jgi:hypothetical protein
MAGDNIRSYAERLQNPVRRDAGSQYGRLSIFRQLQLAIGSLKTKSAQCKAQGIIGLIEYLPGLLKLNEKFATHTRILRTLTRKKKCSFDRHLTHIR